MRRPFKSLFVFDLDGTLVDAYRAIEESLNYTLRELGYYQVSLSKVRKSVGRGDRLFIGRFFDSKDVPKALPIYRQHHKNSLMRFSRLRPFAKSVLSRLKSKKKYVAIASNRPTAFTNIILKRLKIKRYIDYVLCADRVKKIKPNPQMLKTILKKFKLSSKEAVYVGDMGIDLEAAKRSRLDAVFVKGGSGTAKEAKEFKNARIVYSLKEILCIYE